MTDINSASSEPARALEEITPAAFDGDEAEIVHLIELLFFAYRDFISDPDAILHQHGFGRAHHRVIHFVGRNPGMRVAEILNILKITKQSFGRVLRDLVEAGFIFQREGPRDRRHRLLYLTTAGHTLHRQLMAPQIERLRRAMVAMRDSGDVDETIFARFLQQLINENERDQVLKLTGWQE